MSGSYLSAAYTSRIEALRNKYSILNTRIEEAQKRPTSADFYLTQLKKQRLLILEELETMREASSGAA